MGVEPQGNPNFTNLHFSNLPITRSKSRSLSLVEDSNFTQDFSNKYRVPWMLKKKIGIPLHYRLQYSVPVSHFSVIVAADVCNALMLKNGNFH